MPGSEGFGEFTEGKTAAATELRFRLPRAGVKYLEGALQNPQFGEEHLEAILSNPALPSGLIQRIAARKRWLARYEVQRAIIGHRNAPRVLKLNLIHFLRWRDLARLGEDPHSPPPVRRAAETILKARVEEMSLGEKIALARIASPGVIPALRTDPHPEVITALLGNGRLTEPEVVALCSWERIPGSVLSAVASNPRWRGRYPVKMALLRNPRTPASASLRFLASLAGSDLTEIASSVRAPRLVRATAKQILQARSGSVDRDGAVT